MAIYAIHLAAPSPETWKRVEKAWANRHFRVSETLILVAPEEATITEEVWKRTIGDVAVAPFGIVTEVGAYHGFYAPSLWEWLTKFS